MTDKWGPTRTVGNQPDYEYVYDKDRLVCCGCVVHRGAETGPCDCRCHQSARQVAVLSPETHR